MIVVVDTNVVLSAALRDRLPERVVLFISTRDDWKWLVTPEILAEYVDVLRRQKFSFSLETIAYWTELIDMRTINVADAGTSPHYPRDPNDAPFLRAALAHGADFILTGDKDLLAAKGAVPARIVTVADFAQEYQIS